MKLSIRVSARSGVSLIEMMIAVTMLLLVIAAAVPFFRLQTRSISANTGRNDAQQYARFSMSAIDRDLRVAGAGIVNSQPLVVQAHGYAITFNADLVTTDPADPGAVYVDPDAQLGSTTVLPSSRKITLPASSYLYPDTTYFQSATGAGPTLPSRAETVSYWVSLDSSSTRPDDYVMFRRVNDMVPTVVARAIVLPSGQPIFRYFKVDSLGVPRQIANNLLPLYHFERVHGANTDTGKSALTDSIRSVRVRISSAYKDSRGDSALRAVEGSIRLLNAGLVKYSSCGEPPLPSALAAVYGLNPQNEKVVSLTWVRSTDEGSGEKDVERYALFRRNVASPEWGEPIASVPSGLVNYVYVDGSVASGDVWVYGLIAQDCTPASSSLATAGPIPIP